MTFQPPTKSFPGFDEGLLVQEVVTIRDGSTWLRWREGGEEDPADSESRRSYMEQANGWRLADEVEPDPNDGATKGALLEVVREAFDAPAAQVTPYVRWDPVARRTVIDEWMVCLNDADDRSFRGHATEFAALEAAWQVAP